MMTDCSWHPHRWEEEGVLEHLAFLRCFWSCEPGTQARDGVGEEREG